MQHSKGRPAGQKKTGGRPKGAQNKVTADFRQRLEASGFDVITAAIKLFEDDETPHEIKFKCLYLLTEFSFYKPKNPLDIPGSILPPKPAAVCEELDDGELDDAIDSSF